METIKATLAKLEEFATAGQPSQWLEATPEATPPSQRRSSVASMELAQPDLTAPRYPVDTITEAQHCELVTKCQNLTLKAALGSVTPPLADGTFHCRTIPHGYDVVTVDEIMEGFHELELDHPTSEGEIHLRAALWSTCLWRKEYIKLPNWTPPQQTQPDPQRTPPHSTTLLSSLPESSPAHQPSSSPQRTLTEEAPQQNPPLSCLRCVSRLRRLSRPCRHNNSGREVSSLRRLAA